MKRGWIVLTVAASTLLVGVIVVGEWEGSAASAVHEDPVGSGAGASRDASAAVRRQPAPVAAALAAVPASSLPAPMAVVVPPAIPVMASTTTLAGPAAPPDARVPPIDPPPAEAPERAQPWEVADPALYRAREQRLEREADARFVQAAATRLPQLRAAVDEMRARGASPSDIARAEDKISHLQAVQDALLRGAPLAASAPIGGPASRQ